MKFNTSQAKELHQLSLFTDVVFDKMYKKLGQNVSNEDILLYQQRLNEISTDIYNLLIEMSEEFEIKSVIPKLEKFQI
ncbi:MAG: hypothetical protein KN64_00115 [Sulfurovum sp. AS07-7]|jgi:hypothetical protein|uniref:hypothetical protein n=1 Tax=Aliarcobacter TaxID=2321111 RepID=UPI00059A7BB6|nr:MULTISPECIES: hypothetical protein [Aliarcobacter]KIM05958.1 MAG: hypothetical protein KN64_00115 [Sulfurovum sp. AS07-7]MBD3830657.1 hypothetical protein [Arcobacter sp.]NCC19366.1 hypothetical protein [Bacteroidia bacterium]QEZ90316.1 hypothetical protein ACIB15232_a0147 [Aliarcobacter cibarius]